VPWGGQLGRACLAPNRSVENHVQKKSLFKSPSVPCLVRNRDVRPAHLSDSLGNGHLARDAEGLHDTSPRAMAATLRAPARAALASSSSRLARCRSSRRTLAASASASPRGSEVEVITFDLDDTLWPTTPVVMAANQAFVDFCQERIPGFPDCAGVNEYMKVSARAARAPNLPSASSRPALLRASRGDTLILIPSSASPVR